MSRLFVCHFIIGTGKTRLMADRLAAVVATDDATDDATSSSKAEILKS